MFTAANVFSVLRSLLVLFTRTRPGGISRRETADSMVMTDTPEGSDMVRLGFDMQIEIAKLAERIVEPVAAKLTMQELEHVVDRIGHAFGQFTQRRITADTNFENIAVDILEPVQLKLSDAEFIRTVDRLRGAMAAFCASDCEHGAA